jgi:hypothetical protein
MQPSPPSPKRQSKPCGRAAAIVVGALAGSGCLAAPADLGSTDHLSEGEVFSTTQAVVDGERPTPDQATGLVKMTVGDGGACSASFLRPGLVITADHCHDANVTMNVGAYGFRQSVPVLASIKIDRPGENVDLRLYKLDVGDQHNALLSVPLVELASCDSVTGKPVTVYGRKGDTSAEEDDSFRKATVTIDATSMSTVAGRGEDAPNWVFRGLNVNHEVIVPGDSGGPVYLDGKLVGINSGGREARMSHAGSATFVSVCDYANEIRNAAIALDRPLYTDVDQLPSHISKLQQTCLAQHDRGANANAYRDCLAGYSPYLDDAAVHKAVITHCRNACLEGSNPDSYRKCLEERGLRRDADDEHLWNEIEGFCNGLGIYSLVQTCLWDRVDDTPDPTFEQDVPFMADFDDDGLDDLAIWRPSTATWHVRKHDGMEPLVDGIPLGESDDIPLVGDVNGDGRADLVTWRRWDGRWFAKDADGKVLVDGELLFGTPTAKPVLGDFDGDGDDDFGIFHPNRSGSGGSWFWARSLDSDTVMFQSGLSQVDVVALAGDYDGDGADEFVRFQPSTGRWYAVDRNGKQTLSGVGYGRNGDIPLVGDITRDGADDLMVFRPSTGTWYARTVSGTTTVNGIRHGSAGQLPLVADVTGGYRQLVIYDPTTAGWFGRYRWGKGVFRTKWGESLVEAARRVREGK